MKVEATVDVSGMTRFNPDKRAPLWWGILGLITIEAAVVASFVASYFYLAMRAEQWPPPGLAPPPLLWPTINLGLLLLSSLTMFWAGRGIRRGNQKVLTLGVSTSVLLACAVLVLRTLEFIAFDFDWKTHSYGAIVWTLAGFHFVHVVSIVVGSAVVAVLAGMGYFTRERQIGVVVDTNYWYFVTIAWIPLYFTLYWVPRLYME